jgi:hypothetical protein
VQAANYAMLSSLGDHYAWSELSGLHTLSDSLSLLFSPARDAAKSAAFGASTTLVYVRLATGFKAPNFLIVPTM